MQTTSTTQRLRLKIPLSLIIFVISLVSSRSFAQSTPNGSRCFIGPNIGCATCMLGYPDNSNLPRSAVIFNESEVLRAADPGPGTCGAAPTTIKVWYNDEHALTLGVRRVVVKTSAGSTTTDYPITPTPATPTCVNNPLVGSTISSGDQSGNDVADGGGRPMYPALFITDLTVNGTSSRAGDWQYGGTPLTPHRVCGTWKGAVKTVDKTVSPTKITITPDADPAKNNWNLGGGDAPPPGTTDQGYGAVVYWNVADLGLIPGHSYRLQFMVHDGDQNKTGGDVGESCTTIVMPGGNETPVTPRATTTWSTNGNNITIRTTLNKAWIDNTYGSNAIGYPSSGHAFVDLLFGDFLRLGLYDGNGALKMDLKLDYMSASAAAPSGYKSLGVSGGDGQLIKGNSGDIISVKTSLDENFNNYNYVLTSNSPATTAGYIPNPSYPNWIYDVWYEVTVKTSVFGGAGFGYPEIPAVHANHNKAQSAESAMVPEASCPVNTVSLGNLVWDDKNNNGIKNLDEPGVNGAVVYLYQDQNNDNVPNGPAIATTTTDANGFYHFTGLAEGNYIVGVVLPYNTSMGQPNPADPDNDIDNDSNGWQMVGNEVRSKTITLVADTEPTNDGDGEDANETLDFAIVVNYGAVGDYVWIDDNGNGRQDVNEPGVPNVIVKLYTCAGALVSTTATDALGEYIFINVPATSAGTSYKVQFSNLPANYEFTFQNKAGVATDLNSKPNRTTGFTDCFTLHAGEANMDEDAGIFAINIVPVTLSKFQGIYTGGVTRLTWSTNNEFNFDHYEIERSADASSFTNIGRVTATGGTGDNYAFNDVSPVAGANYYRLKIVDRNGYAKYTNIIMINVSVKGLAIGGTYPSPFKDNVTVNISSDASQGAVVKVIDVTGKIVLTEIRQLQAGSNSVRIDKLGSLASGVYMLKIKAGDDTKTTRLVKE